MDMQTKFRKLFGVMRTVRKEMAAGIKYGPAQKTLAAMGPDYDGPVFSATLQALFGSTYGFRASPMGVEIINRADQGDQSERKALPRPELIREYIRQAQYRADRRRMGYTKFFIYTKFAEWKPELRLLAYAESKAPTASEKAYADAVLPPISEIDPGYLAMARATDLNIFESEFERQSEGGEYMEANEYP